MRRSGLTHVLLVKVPAHVAEIMESLERRALKGDVQASRELRGWLDAYPVEEKGDIEIGEIPRSLRNQLLQRLIMRPRPGSLADSAPRAAGTWRRRKPNPIWPGTSEPRR
jgi:hypothetical protein